MTTRPHADSFGYAWPVGAMLATQAAGTVVLVTVPVLAPEMAAELGVGASFVGIYTGLLFAAATLMLANSGAIIARLGAVRANQLALFGSAAALLVALSPTLLLVMFAALLVGIGYGPNTPSGSQVLAQVVAPHRRALAFSIKQSGAPLGGVAAGLALPWLVAVGGWRLALVCAVALAFLVVLCVEPLRRRLDPPRSTGVMPKYSPKAAVKAVLLEPGLRKLTLGAFLMMLAHGCYQTFFVAYLVEGVGLGLAFAGLLYAVLQGAAAIGRIATGWLADRLGSARGVLVTLAVGSCVSSIACSAFSDEWRGLWLGLVSVLVGVSSSGWYGVFLAQLARRQIDGVGFATGGALFFVYWAVVASPFLVAAIVYLFSSYAPALWVIAVLSGVAAIVFARLSSEDSASATRD